MCLLDLITRKVWGLTLCTIYPAKKAVLVPDLGFLQARWLREITKQTQDAYNLLLLFGCRMTWGRKTVHQLLFF